MNPQFDDVNITRRISEGLLPVAVQTKWGYVDKTGKFIINPQFDEVGDFSGGLAPVRMNDSWGYIDKTGKYVVNPSYASAKEFHGNLALITNDNLWSYIDQKGKVVWTEKPDTSITAIKNSDVNFQGKPNIKISDGKFSSNDPDNRYFVAITDVRVIPANTVRGKRLVAIKSENFGGSGQFISLCEYKKEGSAFNETSCLKLGDRTDIKSLKIGKDGDIELSAVVAGPNDPSCCPTVKKTAIVAIVGEDTLRFQSVK